MTQKTSSFDVILLHYEGINASLLRYCMSDKVSIKIDSVLTGEMDPVTYADHIVKKHYRAIYKALFKEGVQAYNPPEAMTRALVFDRVVICATLLRTTRLRPHGMKGIKDLVSSACLALYFLEDEIIDEVSYCGLADFSSIVKTLMTQHGHKFASGQVALLQNLGNAVSCIHEPDWLFYKPLWKKTFYGKWNRYETLRGFFHIALTSYLMSDMSIVSIFDIERPALFSLMEEFIELIEDNDTTQDQIEKFLYHVNPYTFEIPKPPLLSHILEGDFDMVKDLHRNVYKDIYDKPEVPLWDGKQLCLTFLRTLGQDYAPEMVIETDLTPGRYVNTVLNTHREDLYHGTAFGLTTTKDIAFQTRDKHLMMYTDAIIKNTLLPHVVYRRYLHAFNGDINRALDRVRQTEHLLLILMMGGENATDAAGLSRAASLLAYRVGLQTHLPMDDILKILSLSAALSSLNFARPSKMRQHWRKLLSDNDLCGELRSALFIIIEALQIEDQKQYRDYLGMDHRSFFLFVDSLTKVLHSTPPADEVKSFLSLSPYLTMTTSITLWDQMMWSDSFSTVPEQSIGEVPCLYHTPLEDGTDGKE